MSLRVYATSLFIFCASICTAYTNKFVVDSIDVATKEHVRIAEHKIGNADYHKFGNVIIEQRDNKYYITFPFFQYTANPQNPDSRQDEIIPKGTKIFIKLDNGKKVVAETKQDINLLWHYWWHYSCSESTAPGYTGKGYNDGVLVYKYHSKISQARMQDFVNGTKCDLYGLNWLVKFAVTPADMQLLSHHNISDAYITNNGSKISLPIKPKQAVKIKKSIRAFTS